MRHPESNDLRFQTRAIHAGQKPEAQTGAVIVPVFQTSTFEQQAIGRHKGFEYSRTANPTRSALEKCLASLEQAKYALAFSSGVAATTAVISLLKKGSHVVAGDDIYGGTYRLFEKIFKKWGLRTSYARTDDHSSFEKAIGPKTGLIWIESPTNPLLKVIDIQRLSDLARKKGILLAVDNTFASPFFQQPLNLGADIVVHSTTKYIAGHSDVIGGSIATNNESLNQQLHFYQNSCGSVPGPWDCWLTLRGLKTLAVRMRQHEQNARFLVQYLSGHDKVSKVYYPGINNISQARIVKKQMSGSGGMISMEIKNGFAAVERFLSALKLFTLGESLGGVESLVCYPAQMTHGSIPEKERLKRGIKNNLVRLSVGIEDKRDLKNDLRRALLKA